MIKIDIFDKALGDAHELMVTPELVEKEINPRLVKGWTLSVLKHPMREAIAQGRTVTFDYLQKTLEKEKATDLTLRAPMTAG
jgi:hypothetical protein